MTLTLPVSHTFYNSINMAEPTTVQEMATGPVSKQVIDPWNVQGEIGVDGVAKAINYLNLVEDFGTRLLAADGLLERFEKVTGHKPHRFMRRGIVFSHRDLDLILDRYESGEPFFLYTGRGPSSDSMHVGHTVPFEFTKYGPFSFICKEHANCFTDGSKMCLMYHSSLC